MKRKNINIILPNELKLLIEKNENKNKSNKNYLIYSRYIFTINNKLFEKLDFDLSRKLCIIINARFLNRARKRYAFNIMIFKKILLEKYNVCFDPIFPIIRSYLIPSFEDLFSKDNVKFI